MDEGKRATRSQKKKRKEKKKKKKKRRKKKEEKKKKRKEIHLILKELSDTLVFVEVIHPRGMCLLH